ncbi:MAG: molybdopterin molybdotransferase MoeA [Leptospirales bacterium]|nr:molybdopterin molybdotransferase MoeA [Leptospirales bacterium]
MISYSEALAALLAHKLSLPAETIPLAQAGGRVLAAEILADRDYPPFNRATMDGYAIRSVDFAKGSVYRANSWKHAGDSGDPALLSNVSATSERTCIGISTGAAVPADFDTVIRVEDSRVDPPGVNVNMPHNVTFVVEQIKHGQNVARQGEDIGKGQRILGRGTRISPGATLALASVGATAVSVFKWPRIRVVSCGNEVIPAESNPWPEQIRDSNSHTCRSFLGAIGLAVEAIDLIPDDPAKLREALRQGLSADILIVTGGVSKGPHDFIPGLLEELNVTRIFHGVAIKPGKPVFAGYHGGKIVLALPGNPLSVLVACEIFLRPYLLASTDSSAALSWPMRFQGERKKRSGLDEFFPSKLNATGIETAPWNGSGDILAGLCEGFALHPAESAELRDGDLVRFFPWTGA